MGRDAMTYVEHLAAAQARLEGIEGHANPIQEMAVAQAHALVGIGLLLELLVGMVDQPQEEVERAFQVVRIVGGMGEVMH